MASLRLLDRALGGAAATVLCMGALAIGGCAQTPPPEAAVPVNPGANYVPTQAPPKPLPDSAMPSAPSPGPYSDEPILQQRLPEEEYFVNAYDAVHQPRLAIYVNRTLTGQVISPNPGGPLESTEHTQSATGGVSVNSGDYSEHEDAYGRDVEHAHSGFSSTGPAEYTETTTTYLPPSDYDEADVRSLDYDAMEKILTDWMSCEGKVHIISSDYLGAQLSPDDMKALSEGRPIAMSSLAQKVGADVLIQVQAHPTRQADGGLQVRLVAEAMNVRGGDSLATAVVDLPLPLEKMQLNQYTRFIAAKLMVGMAGAWDSISSNPPPGPPPPLPPPPSRQGLPPVPPASQPSDQMNLIP